MAVQTHQSARSVYQSCWPRRQSHFTETLKRLQCSLCARSVCGNISKYHGTSPRSDTASACPALLFMDRPPFDVQGSNPPPEDAGDWGTGSARRRDAASQCQHRGSTVCNATAEPTGAPVNPHLTVAMPGLKHWDVPRTAEGRLLARASAAVPAC